MGSNVETCPVRAWLAAAALTQGPLLRNVNRHGGAGAGHLDGGSIARIIKRVVASTGHSSVDYTGHSLRAGLITSAVQAGRTEAAIMRMDVRACRGCRQRSAPR